jgi:hypothetical protein
MGVVIEVGKGTMRFTSPSGNQHIFPRGKRGRRKASGDLNASFENTWFPLSAPSSKALKKSTLGR